LNPKKTYASLHEVHKVKKKEIKKFSRSEKLNAAIVKRELKLHYGSVWGIDDKSVPFDAKRKDEDLKESLRPCLVIETPKSFEDYDLVEMAPGTTHFHPVGIEYPECLRADVPPEDLYKTTYFLLYLRWSSVQKNLFRNLTELSTELKNLLIKYL
jgi:hypothetical protein